MPVGSIRDFYMEPTGITADVSALLEPAMRISYFSLSRASTHPTPALDAVLSPDSVRILTAFVRLTTPVQTSNDIGVPPVRIVR